MFWSACSSPKTSQIRLQPFCQITKDQIEGFTQDLSIFAESFNMHGPGAVGDDLEKDAAVTSFLNTVTYLLIPIKKGYSIIF